MSPTSRLSTLLFSGLIFVNGLIAQEPDLTTGIEITYAVGADLSFLKSAEDRGVQFKENGVVRPGLDIFRDHGEATSGRSERWRWGR